MMIIRGQNMGLKSFEINIKLFKLTPNFKITPKPVKIFKIFKCHNYEYTYA